MDMETKSVPNSPKRLDRKTVERNRRIQMKALILQLTSLVPPHHFNPSKEMLSQKDQIDQVASYIKQLSERVEGLKKRKKLAKKKAAKSNSMGNYLAKSSTRRSRLVTSPRLEVKEMGSNLEVVLVHGMEKNFALHEVIKVLVDEGLEVISASISTANHHTYYILHAQVKLSRFGVDSSMIRDRLHKLFR